MTPLQKLLKKIREIESKIKESNNRELILKFHKQLRILDDKLNEILTA